MLTGNPERKTNEILFSFTWAELIFDGSIFLK